MKLKNIIVYTSCFLLIFALVACGKQPLPNVTETDKTNSAIQSAKQENPSTTEEKPAESKAASATPSASEHFKKTESSYSSSPLSQEEDQGHDAVANPPPQYNSIAALESFLKNNHAENSDQANALASVQSSGGYYYRPLITEGNKNWVFSKVNLYGILWHYYYKFSDSSLNEYDVQITTCSTNFEQSFFEFMKNKALNHEEGCYFVTLNGIEYAYSILDEYNETTVVWQQYGNTHMADIKNCNDQIDSILPYLQVEKVKLQANDHVTQ